MFTPAKTVSIMASTTYKALGHDYMAMNTCTSTSINVNNDAFHFSVYGSTKILNHALVYTRFCRNAGKV